MKTEINIKGMHCKSCEILIKDELSKIKNISGVSTSYHSGKVFISHSKPLSEQEISEAINKAGYSIGEDNSDWFSTNLNDYIDILLISAFIIIIYIFLNEIGLFSISLFNKVSFNSLSAIFLAGSTAGLSTCMVLVGGMVLGLGTRFAELYPNASPKDKIKPQLFFNLGRFVSFIFFGGLMGLIGSVISISEVGVGILTILASFLLLFIGLQLIKLFPKLDTISFSLPTGIYSFLGISEKQRSKYSHRGAMILGGLSFFVPCGFTQAAQLYAVSTGSVVQGAVTMGLFALGTFPGLMGVGSFSTFIKGNFGRIFFKVIGVILIGLSILNVLNGYRLISLKYNIPSFSIKKSEDNNLPEIIDGYQVVNMDQELGGYYPNIVTVRKDIPVRWIVNSKTTYSCASSLIAPSINIRKNLELGENIFEFTPKEVGVIRFSCAMGMYSGEFKVVD